ncbi:MAG: serpin family protein [Halioglobus sp.]
MKKHTVLSVVLSVVRSIVLSVLHSTIFIVSLLIANVSQASTSLQVQQATTVNQLSGAFLSSKLKNDGVGNAMISSASLYYALSILERGAAEESAHILKSVLLDDLNLDLPTVSQALVNALTPANDSTRSGAGVFQMYNSIWSTNGQSNGKPFVFSDQFVDDAKHYYAATHQSLDFVATGASRPINNWALEKTRGLIPEVIDDLTMRDLEWVVMNAAYFEGAWSTPMTLIEESEEYQFIQLDGSKTSAATIVTSNYKSTVLDRADGSLAFYLPFVGGKYSLVIYLPGEDVANIEQWLADSAVLDMPEVVRQLLQSRSQRYQLAIQLPKFSFSDEVEMLDDSKIAADLGLMPLYSEKANFLPMSDAEKTFPANRDTKVGLIKQDTKIELDENGLKAAAVTMIGGITKTSYQPKPFPMREIVVDRPFVFSIVENRSQTMLFNGVLVAPES